MFNTKAFENSRPDGFPVLEVVPQIAPDGSTAEVLPAFVPLKFTSLKGEVTGPLASLLLTQTFGYTHTQTEQILEALYRFPLPGDAAVTGVRVRFGDVEIVAELKERQQAETDYQEAVQQGQQAALATRESPDVFTLRVAGLQPDQDVMVETAYIQLARTDGSDWTLRVPLTTSPRYVRADEVASRHAQGQPLALLRDPGHRFRLDLMFAECGDVSSSTHSLDTQDIGGNLRRVRLRDGDVLPDRDLLLSWQAVQESSLPGLSVLLHDDVASGYVYFLAQVAPPRAKSNVHGNDAPISREAVLLVDHSGSMDGAKWEAADWAVKQFLGGLSEKDAFSLGLFHDTTRWFSHGGLYGTAPHSAIGASVKAAIEFLEQHEDSGGTNLGVALEQALSLRRASGEPARHVVIVTDAEVTDGGRLFRLAESEAARPDRRRISVLCIDAAPNAFLANELAERGGGVARFLTSAPEEEDITTALDAVLEDFAQPVLANLCLNVNRAGAQASGRNPMPGRDAQHSAIDLGDLPRGRAVWVAGRVKRGDSPELNFTVSVGGHDVAAYRADVTKTPAQRPALKALFGARRVLALEYLATAHYDKNELEEQLTRLGYDAKSALTGSQPKTVYAENAEVQPHDALKQLLVTEALEYGLASSETAFVARRTEAGKPIDATVVVANALPSDWSDVFAVGAAPMAMAKYSGAAPSAPMAGGGGMLRRLHSANNMAFEEKARGISLSASATGQPAFRMEAGKANGRSGQPLFAGVPVFSEGAAVLFDTNRDEDAAKLPSDVRLTGLIARFPGGSPDPDTLDPDLTLLLFVDDLTVPRARVRLSDLLRQGGTRPLNVQRQAGQTIRITLVDKSGSTNSLPTMEVALQW
jgi:Ca-activated chloride channel family protein